MNSTSWKPLYSTVQAVGLAFLNPAMQAALHTDQMHPYDDVSMKKQYSPLHFMLLLSVLGAAWVWSDPAALAQLAAAPAPASQPNARIGVLDRVQATAILPPSVFYKGASASVQGRNSAGIRFTDGALALMALVDASGYSSAVQQTYQGYLLNELRLQIGDKTLAPGAYGFGFIAGNRMVVMDIGGSEILRATTTRDEMLAHPTPLQIIPDASVPGHYRLYLGRSYVTLSAAQSSH